jgi:predicted alpha/beta hydrolase family esterase
MNTTTAPSAHSPRRVVLVHGYGAGPDAHWYPWLAGTLEGLGIAAHVVALPAPHAPRAAAWERSVASALGIPDETTWIVAHSLGCITALRVLASLTGPWRLGGAVFVAGFTGPLVALPVLDGYLADDVDVGRVAKNVSVRIVVRSDCDAYVPAAATDSLAERLGAELRVQRDAGHFLAENGVTEFPLLVDMLTRH